MIEGVLSSAVNGLRIHAGDAARASGNLVKATSRPDNLEEGVVNSVVELTQAKVGFAASAKVLSTGDEMAGRLIDIFA